MLPQNRKLKTENKKSDNKFTAPPIHWTLYALGTGGDRLVNMKGNTIGGELLPTNRYRGADCSTQTGQIIQQHIRPLRGMDSTLYAYASTHASGSGGGYSQLAVHDTYMIWQRNNKLGRVLAHIHGATEIRNYRSRFSKVFILDSGQQQHRSSPARIGCRI